VFVVVAVAPTRCSVIADVPAPSARDADGRSDHEGGSEVDGEADVPADGDGDADGADADAEASDAETGSPARGWGELTASGTSTDRDGCAARSTHFCLRSDSTDPAAAEASSTRFRVRGILTGGMTP
jgi:hypothetical protein